MNSGQLIMTEKIKVRLAVRKDFEDYFIGTTMIS